MKSASKNSSTNCMHRFNAKTLPQNEYLNQKKQKLYTIRQQKIKKYSAYNLRGLTKTIKLNNLQTEKVYSPPLRNFNNKKQNSASNSQIDFNYLFKANNTISKSPNYNCDNYQYFYNFYLNNSSPNTLTGNLNEANSTIIQNYNNPLYQTMVKTDNYRRNNTLNNKKKIYQRPKQKICTEMFINTNNDRKNNFTNFEIVYDNTSISPNLYTANNTEYSSDLAKTMAIKKKYLMNNSVKEKKIETFRTNMVSNNPIIDISSFNIYDNKLSINNKYNKSTLDVSAVLKTKKINLNEYIANKSSINFYKLANSEPKIYVKKNNKIYNKKFEKKNSNNFFNNSKYISKNSLYCKELKKFFSDMENSKNKNNEKRNNPRSIFDNILDVHKNILLIQSTYRRHLSRVKFCILKIMSNFIEGFNLIEDVFYKKNFQKMKNQINNLYPKNNDYCIKTQERIIPKFNNKDFEKLNSFNFNNNKKMIYYCLELPSTNLNEKHNIIEDIAKGKIKIKNEKLSQIKNNFKDKKSETIGDINHSWEFDSNVNNDIETSNFTNVLNTEENNLDRDKNEKTITFSRALFPKKYNKKFVKFKKIIATQK